jgi:CTD small phosphatase-like protein 2
VVDYLDPKRELIAHRLFRDHCVQTEEGMFIKDLRVLGERKLSQTLIIDNAAYSFGFQIDNGVPCLPFYNNKKDQELRSFTEYAKHLAGLEDMVGFNRNYFKLFMYKQAANLDILKEKIGL